MKRSPTERIRIVLSRVVMGAVGVLILVSDSAWKDSIVSGILFVIACALVSIGTVGRVWATLYVAGRKTKTLVTSGPYSICRNPLYFFSLLGGMGVTLATGTLTLPALFAIPFALYYPWVIRSEERRLRDAHGAAFDDYCRATPAFWPRFPSLREEETYTVNAVYFRKGIIDTIWFFWLVGIIRFVTHLQEIGLLHVRLTLP
jgi:protein-S-isoprenylcysteine O-methyltransferase Ste14